MSDHTVTVQWKRETEDFKPATYSRDHQWIFGGGVVVPGSSAPEFRGTPSRVDPEEAFVASLSSCHMLTFLYHAARKGFVIDTYTDDASGILEKQTGGMWMSRVVLRPRIVWSGETRPSPEDIETLHEHSHRDCFIARSVMTDVAIDLGV